MKRKPGQVSLDRALSKLGIASRTQAREYILSARVRVNGILRKDPSFAVIPERIRIEIDGIQTQAVGWKTLLLNKPRGTVTTRSDEKDRPTVFSCLKNPDLRLHAIGRLDWATSGLLILTNDTRLSAWLTDPENAVVRIYTVTVRGKFSEKSAKILTSGIKDEGELLQAAEVHILKTSGKESQLIVKLTEGKNREIRRMFSSLGHEVTRLKRIAYGGLELGDLESGQYRELSMEEISAAFPGVPLRKR